MVYDMIICSSLVGNLTVDSDELVNNGNSVSEWAPGKVLVHHDSWLERCPSLRVFHKVADLSEVIRRRRWLFNGDWGGDS